MGKNKSQTVGYGYFAGLAVALCGKVDGLISFKLGDEVKYHANVVGNQVFPAMTGELGTTYNSGSGKTNIYFYDGSQTNPDTYIEQRTNSPIAYNGTSYFVLRQGFIGDNVSSVPNYGCIVRRTHLNDGWTREQIGNDVNPAAAIYYILKSMIGYPDELIDEASFLGANETLYNEGFGISFTMTQSSEAKTYIDEILKTIDGVIQINPLNGKMRLKLLRGDYTVDNLPKINETNSAKVTFSRRGNEELSSRVVVQYKENRGNKQFIDNSVSAINTAARLLIGYERTYSANLKMITTAANAKKALNREFKRNSYPLASVKFTCSAREFGNLAVGDVINFSNEALGVLNMPVRIMAIGGDKETTQEIEISAGEDIFALGNMVITTEQGGEGEAIVFDLPDIQYADIKDAPPESVLNQRAVLCFAAYPKGFVQFMTASDGISGESIDLPQCYLGALTAPYGITDDMDEGVGFNVQPLSDMWDVALTDAGFQRLKGFAYIGDELIGYQFRTSQTDGSYTVTHIMRGLMNTVKTSHPKNTRVWFFDVDANDFDALPIQSPTPSISFRAGNMRYTTPDFTINHNYKFSVETPYPPANVQGMRDGNTITISWYPCVRLGGAGPRNADNIIAGQDEGNYEGEWLIEWSGGSQIVDGTPIEVVFPQPIGKVYIPTKVGNGFVFSRDESATKIYTIRSRLNGYLSKPKTVTI
jgi:hypothetical protein